MLVREALVILSQLSRFMAEKREEPLFASTGVGKQSNRNRRCEVLLTNDPQISAPESPAVKGSGLGYIIRNRVGKLN